MGGALGEWGRGGGACRVGVWVEAYGGVGG